MKKTENRLSIHLTDICNNKCKFCVVDSPGALEELKKARTMPAKKYALNNVSSAKTIFRYLEMFKGQEYRTVNIHGGEPTIRKDFTEILKKIVECGYESVILQTNGRRFASQEFTESVCSLDIVHAFTISVHGSNGAVHDAITQVPGSLGQAVQGIKNIKRMRPDVMIRTNSVVSRMNFQDFPNIMDLLISLGINHINISALHTTGRAYRNFDEVTPTFEEAMPYVRIAVDRVRKAGISLTLEGFPLCVITGMQEHLIDWPNEKFKMLFRGTVIEDYQTHMDSKMRIHGRVCDGCEYIDKCGGVYKEYIQKHGWSEFGK